MKHGYIENEKLPSELLPYALIYFEDNIREDAISTIKWFKDNDVQIKIISGDDPVTVSEIARRAGVNNADKYRILFLTLCVTRDTFLLYLLK